MRRKNNDKQSTVIVQTLLTCYLLIEQLDDLATQECFRHTMKSKAKMLLVELEERADKGLAAALNVDAPLVYDLLDQRKKLITAYATFTEEEINEVAIAMNQIIDKRTNEHEKDKITRLSAE